MTLAVLSASAQQRIPCDRTLLNGQGRAATRGLVYASSVSKLKGDVHVPVVLAAFKDVPFTIPNSAAKWDAMLNQKGFSEHQTAGCLNEYFMKQSGGQFNITFDVMGPVTLPDSMKYYGANSAKDPDVVNGVKDASAVADVVKTEVFILSGAQVKNGKGVAIVRQTLSNGVVIVKKIRN